MKYHARSHTPHLGSAIGRSQNIYLLYQLLSAAEIITHHVTLQVAVACSQCYHRPLFRAVQPCQLPSCRKHILDDMIVVTAMHMTEHSKRLDLH